MIFKDKTEQCEGVCVGGEGDCLVWSKMFRNSIFLPSDDIRPKSGSIGYIIRCTFENYFKPCSPVKIREDLKNGLSNLGEGVFELFKTLYLARQGLSQKLCKVVVNSSWPIFFDGIPTQANC